MPQFDFTNWTILILVVFFSFLTMYLWFGRFLSISVFRFLKVQNKSLIN